MERTILPLEGGGITGIVGPNGCGKSNIVDALRWVLGESKASALRGQLIEDVIFNGTDSLRPLGLAEVNVTIRAHSDNLWSDILKSPGVNLCSSGEEAIKVDIRDLASADSLDEREELTQNEEEQTTHLRVIDGGLSEKQTSGAEPLYSQEKDNKKNVDQNINEDASPLNDSEAAATRFSWLKALNEVQITRRLYRSGESEFFINRIQCRLRDIKELARALGINARGYTVVAQGEVTRIISAKPEERRLIIEESAGVLGIRDKIAAAKRRLEETSSNLTRLTDVISEASRQLNSLRIQAGRARNRETLKAELKEKEIKLLRDERRLLAVKSTEKNQIISDEKSREGELISALNLATSQDGEVRARMLSLDIEAQESRGKIEQLREELDRRATKRHSLNSKLHQLKTLVAAKETEIKQLDDHLSTLEARRLDNQREEVSLREKEKQLVAALIQFTNTSADAIRALADKRDSKRHELREAERALAEVREAIAATESSIQAKQEQLKAAAPLDQLKKALKSFDFNLVAPFLAIKGDNQHTSTTSYGVTLAEEIDVPERYSRALQSVLAERGEFILADDIKGVANLFINNRKSDAAAIGIFLSRKDTFPQESNALESITIPCQADPSATALGLIPLLKCFKATRRVSHGLVNHLKNVYLSETLEGAFYAFASGTLTEMVIVTLEGEILTSDSFYSLKHQAGLVEIKTSLSVLEGRLKAQLAEKKEREALRDSISLTLKALDEEHSRLIHQAQEVAIKEREVASQLGNVRGRLQAAENLTLQNAGDINRSQNSKASTAQNISKLSEEITAVESAISNLVTSHDNQLREALKEERGQLELLEKNRAQGREDLSKTTEQLINARSCLDKLRSVVSRAELEAEKANLELRAIEDRVLREYPIEVFEEIKLEASALPEEEREELNSEVQKLRARLIREGEVDPTSIERYGDEKKRFEELELQRNDLNSAKSSLEKTISQLRQSAETRFKATFTGVADNFSNLIPRLFGGGRGEIVLLDPSNPLDSGIDINVRPPGKKPKSIELLSGGEKALSATAMIIAMFLVKPSPLCILDEVDAPLDEANLERFLGVIKEMSLKTQFVLITHNKASMAASDTLVGVTQKEPGASRLISVSLQQAYQAVA
jgi:chromosome segregation protein